MTAAASRPEPPLVGTTIFEQYRVTSLLAGDGVCDRYLVRPVGGGATAQARVFVHPAFARGAEALWDATEASIQRLGAVEHPNVQRVLSAGVLDTFGEARLCLVTEHAEGETVEVRARGERRIPVLEALGVGQRVLHGLAAIHQVGLVHADLRAANVRFVRGAAAGDATAWPVLCDVAIGNLLLDAMGRPPSLRDQVFCAEALAPEQIEGDPASVATDIYAFGALFYRMVTGTAPFLADDDSELLVAVLSEDPRSLAEGGVEVPAPLEALVRRCLARRPEERFESTVALVRALRDCEQALASPGKSASEKRSFFGAGGSTPLENKRPSRPAPSESGLHAQRLSEAPSKSPDASSRRAALGADGGAPKASALRASTLPPAPFARARTSQPPAAPPAEEAAPRASVAPFPALTPPPPPAPEAEESRDLARTLRWMGVAVGVMLTLVVVSAAALVQGRRARLDTAVATLRAPLLPANVRVTLRANTDGAQALLRGRTHPLPVRMEVTPGTEPELLEVSAAGFETQRLWVVLNGHTEVQIELTRAAVTPAATAPVVPARVESSSERRRRERRERDLARRGIRVMTAAEAAVQPPVPVGEPLTGEAIQRVVRQHRAEVGECARRARQTTPGLSGRVAVSIVVAPDGAVRTATWNGTNPAHQAVAQCITETARRWTFPPTGASGDIHVVYPFSLR